MTSREPLPVLPYRERRRPSVWRFARRALLALGYLVAAAVLFYGLVVIPRVRARMGRPAGPTPTMPTTAPMQQPEATPAATKPAGP